jgi:hypothetical protein
VLVTDGLALTASATLWATISEVRSRSSSISNKAISDWASSGNPKISPSKFLAKTVLPAPIKVIFGIKFSSLTLLCLILQ